MVLVFPAYVVPLDLLVYETDSQRMSHVVSVTEEDPYFNVLWASWGSAFDRLFMICQHLIGRPWKRSVPNLYLSGTFELSISRDLARVIRSATLGE